jgi:CMP-N-acetylneuraminic acid synthetase
MRINALIPLKGHSARVPGKNLRDFGGRPLFHVIVQTLQRAQRVGTIYLDTDSDDIADSATGLTDVEVIRRKTHLVGDEVSVNLLIADFLADHDDEHLLQTHATNPLLTAATVDAAVDRYLSDPSLSSLFTVTRYQARFYFGDLRPINHDPTELLPTQDLEPLYMENSNLYLFSRKGFLENGRRITNKAAMMEMDPLEAVDIDEERDFDFALSVHAGAERA